MLLISSLVVSEVDLTNSIGSACLSPHLRSSKLKLLKANGSRGIQAQTFTYDLHQLGLLVSKVSATQMQALQAVMHQ